MTARRLLLDLQALQGPDGGRGIGRAVAELAAELDRRDGAVAALLLNPALPAPEGLPEALLRSPRLRWGTVDAVTAALRDGPAIYHVPSPYDMGSPGPIALPDHALRADLPLAVTVHDLIPLHEPERLLPGGLRKRHAARSELVRSADVVCCDSEFTRRDAVGRLGLDPGRTAVTGNGAAARFRPAGAGDDPEGLLCRALPAVRRPHLLCVSGGDERKNTPRLLRAYGRVPGALRRRHQLVVSCDLDPRIGRDWAAQARAAGLGADEVVLTGFITDEVLVALYQRAELVVMPSLDEGYGLPVAEGIACGRPVVTSDRSALPEILDLPESTFDPLDEEAMATVIARGLDDAGFRTRLVAAGERASPHHRWPAVADRVLAAIGRLDAPPARRVADPAPPRDRRRDRRLRVALVGPMPPAASGIADYNARVAAELARHVDLDVLTPQRGRAAGPGGDAPWAMWPAQALGRTLDPASYHAIVYTVGNSWHHVPTRALALRHRGVVWFHDVRLAALHADAARAVEQDDPGAWMRRRLEEEYGDRLGPDLAGAPVLDRPWVHRNGVLLSQELARSARLAVVNTALAERLLVLDQGPDGPVPPILRLELAVPAPPAVPLPQRAWDPPVVATFGNVDAIKAPERLLEAVARMGDATRARIAVVGTLANLAPGHLEGVAARLGVADRLELHGAVDDEEWWRQLHRATVAVQLRRTTNGEASAAVACAQGAGTPVVTNVAGAEHEYPPGAVIAIDPALGPGDLEATLLRLLTDRWAWERHSAAARAHAQRCTFRAVVGRLLTALDALAAGRTV